MTGPFRDSTKKSSLLRRDRLTHARSARPQLTGSRKRRGDCEHGNEKEKLNKADGEEVHVCSPFMIPERSHRKAERESSSPKQRNSGRFSWGLKTSVL